MDWMHALFLVLIGMGAGFVQRVSGFGLGIFSMMLLPHFIPSHTAAATITSLFTCVTTTYNAACYRKNVAYKTVFPVVCSALVAIPIAVYFSGVVSAKVFKLLLGGILIVLSLYFIYFNQNIKIRPTAVNGVLTGVLGGTLNGLFSTGGPPVVLYLSSATADNITYFATIQFYFCVTNIYGITMRAINGMINSEVLLFAAIGIAGCMAGGFAGGFVFDKLDSGKLKRIIYIGMIISGITMIL